MSIKQLVTRGFGNGTFLGTIAFAVTAGYSISTVIPSVIPVSDGLVGNQSTGDGLIGNQSTGASLTGRGRL